MFEIPISSAIDTTGKETWWHGCETHHSAIAEIVVVDTLTHRPLRKAFLVQTHCLFHVIVERLEGGSLHRLYSTVPSQELRIQSANKGEQRWIWFAQSRPLTRFPKTRELRRLHDWTRQVFLAPKREIHPFYLTRSVEFIHKCIFLNFKNNGDIDDNDNDAEEEETSATLQYYSIAL